MSEISENVTKVLDEVNKLSADDKNILILEAFKKYNILELKNFKDLWCETFGVSADAPVMAAGMMPAAAAEDEKAPEPTEFDVVLSGIGDKKIQVIKALRALSGLGLKEAKEVVEAAPKAVAEKVSKEEAEKYKQELEGVGATIEIKGV